MPQNKIKSLGEQTTWEIFKYLILIKSYKEAFTFLIVGKYDSKRGKWLRSHMKEND